MTTREEEVAGKIDQMRSSFAGTGAAAVRLRGTDWFAWATAGGNSAVLLTTGTGVAEVLVTREGAWILTDEIEARRLSDEELPATFDLRIDAWIAPGDRETFVRLESGEGTVLSDLPGPGEQPLPAALIRAKRVLTASEQERYRAVGRLAAEAMTGALTHARPDWTEHRLAGAGSEALRARGLEPALILVAGARRLPLYRHPIPRNEPIGREAMMVFCARGFGLVANLTRFVAFAPLPDEAVARHRILADIEAVALRDSRPGTPLRRIYGALEQAYAARGFPDAIRAHHQGGTCGYRAREEIATPSNDTVLEADMAVAWNPSLPGAKLEDTFLVSSNGILENVTLDPAWPCIMIDGRPRPIPLEI